MLKQGSTVQTLVRSSTIQVIAQIIHTRQFSPFMKQIIDCFATCYYVLPPASYIIYAYRNFTRQSFDTNHLRIQKIVRRSRMCSWTTAQRHAPRRWSPGPSYTHHCIGSSQRVVSLNAHIYIYIPFVMISIYTNPLKEA